MSDDLEPLPPLGGLALRALSAERARGDVDPGMQERVLGRVVASVAIGAAVTGVAVTAHAAGASGAAAGTASATAATGTAATGTAATGAAAVATGLTLKTLPWILAAFVAGGGVGAAVHAAVAPSAVVAPSASSSSGSAAPVGWPAPVVAASSVATAPSAEAPAVPVTALPSAPAPAVATSSAAHAAAPATAPAPGVAAGTSGGNDVDLAAERSLVDRARTALGRGQNSDALAALDAHAARYPQGRLSEEREALAVDALARSGRMDLARARAARFRAAYPNSVFGGVVDAALAPR